MWIDFDIQNPEKYLLDLKMRNFAYIQAFNYFIQGNIVYDFKSCRRQRSFFYNIFKDAKGISFTFWSKNFN